MRYFTSAVLGTLAVALLHCSDGSTDIGKNAATGGGSGSQSTGGSVAGRAGTADPNGSGGGEVSAGNGGGAGTTGSGGSDGTGTAGASVSSSGGGGSGGTGGDAAGSGGASGNVTAGSGGGGGGGAAGGTIDAGGGGGPRSDAAVAESGAPTGGLKSGPFRILVISSVLDYRHASIPDCLQMLKELGNSTDADLVKVGAPPGSKWTVDEVNSNTDAPNYFAEISDANLKNYDVVYSDNPTGPVFTKAPNGAQKKQIFQDYFDNGGSWAGQHSATDFEKNSWSWFQDNVNGGWFVDHDTHGTPGTVVWESKFANHPILKGLPSPWNTNEEWYIMNRNIEAVPGFQILAKVTVANSALNKMPRPAIWVRENPKGGRAFYTIQGHDQSTYKEAQFRDLMRRGVLWAAHRL